MPIDTQERVIAVLTALIDYANSDKRDLSIYWGSESDASKTETYLLAVRATTRQIAELADPTSFTSNPSVTMLPGI
jgi:hypothetical protein